MAAQDGRQLILLVSAALALGGCAEGSDQKAKRRFEMLKSEHASMGEVCDAARDWIRTASESGEAAKYRDAQNNTIGVCLSARLRGSEQLYGEPEVLPDNMDSPSP